MTVHPSFSTSNCHLRRAKKCQFWTILHYFTPFWAISDHFEQALLSKTTGNFEILAKSPPPSPYIPWWDVDFYDPWFEILIQHDIKSKQLMCNIATLHIGLHHTVHLRVHTIKVYIMHKKITVILLVNTTSRDIKYYAYIPNIWREGKKFLYKMDISLILRDIGLVDILPISPMPTLIMWLPWHLLVFVFTDCDQNFWYKWYQIENLGFKLVIDSVLEILLCQCWWCSTNVLVTYVVNHSLSSLPVI